MKNPTTATEGAMLLLGVLSGLPDHGVIEQTNEVAHRQARGELLEINGVWYERVDLNVRDTATTGGRIWHDGDPMPEDRPDVTDRRNIVWSYDDETELYVSALGESRCWVPLLRQQGPLVAPRRLPFTSADVGEQLLFRPTGSIRRIIAVDETDQLLTFEVIGDPEDRTTESFADLVAADAVVLRG